MRIIDFNSPVDGKRISVRVWDGAKDPKGVIQIVHGMAEHGGRYDAFAQFLQSDGYVVFADDHRAHGLTDPDTPGYCGGDIFWDTVRDETALTDRFSSEYRLPVAMFSHSYGSFIAQRYIQRYGGKLCAAVIGGSDRLSGFLVRTGALVAGAACLFGRSKKPANLIKTLTFDSYDRKVGGSFISSLKEETDRYFADGGCGFVLSNAFYRSFFKGMAGAYGKGVLAGIPKNLPILIVSGENDPVGRMGKGPVQLAELYRKNGIEADVAVYNGARHEYLNDVSREQARADILAFFNANVG